MPSKSMVNKMTTANCARCNREIVLISAREIDGLHYCIECAKRSTHLIEEKKDEIQQEKKEIVRERDAIEQELELISEDDIGHIIVTSTDTVEGRPIVEYINIISVQDVAFESIPFNPTVVEGQNEMVERIYRSRIELSLSKLRKRAFLAGAEAVVGLLIDTSMDHRREGRYMAAVTLKINVTGTAVRLTASALPEISGSGVDRAKHALR